MPLKIFKAYMDSCRAQGISPTWEGLRIYYLCRSVEKKNGFSVKTKKPFLNGSSDQS